MNFTPIFLNNRVVGQVNSDGTFQKHAKLRHFLKTPPAICYDVETIQQAKQKGAKFLLVIAEDGSQYRCDLAVFERKSFALNRGYGEQRALRLEFWDRTGVGVAPSRQLSMRI